MPSSKLELAPTILNMAYVCNPNRILDVGPGVGKYGLLIREYLNPVDQLDAVEAWTPYVRQFPWLEAIYDHVIRADVRDLSNELLAAYDVVLMIDVIEHMEKEAGLRLLGRIPGRVIVCTPENFFQNPEADEIPPEKHRSLWSVADFGERVEVDNSQLGGVLVRLKPLAKAVSA